MFFFLRRNRSRPLLYLYVATLVVLLVAAFVLHASGTTLAIIRIARIVVIVAIIGAGAILRRRGPGHADLRSRRERDRD